MIVIRMSFPWRLAAVAVLASALVAALGPAGVSAPAVRRGGTLNFIVPAEPPSFDAHREVTFAVIHPIRPHYNLLVKFDPLNYRRVVPDLAESWRVSEDGLTYTFRIRRGVQFHDGSILTSRDVKASLDKIIFPPPGVVSVRQAMYEMVESVTAPDPHTVVIRLHWRTPTFLEKLASPFNWIYSAAILERDPRWYEHNVMGTGPFRFREYVRGSHWDGVRFENYWKPGRPYLDGFRALFIRGTAPAVTAIKAGRAHVEFRGFSPAARDDIVRALGDRVRVQESDWLCNLLVVPNSRRRPFDDARVRRALTLAIDRWGGSRALSQISFLGPVGGVMRPGAPFATPDAELSRLAGFGRDIRAAREEARRLLREAGVPEGFEFTFMNRNIPMPYEPGGIFLLDQWRQVGLNARHVVKETGPWLAALRAGTFDVSIDFTCDFMDEPSVQLAKFVSADRSPANHGGYVDRLLDSLFRAQSREANAQRRQQIVRQFERRILHDRAYQYHLLWWRRIIPHHRQLQGYRISPSHYLEDIEEVWLSE
jgi:peptide/nickel transport system substrate-binding protein